MSSETRTFDDLIHNFEAEAEKIKAALPAKPRANAALGHEQPKAETKKPGPVKRQKKLPRGIHIHKSGWYGICYFDRNGKRHREKASPLLEGAKAALEKRRTQIRELKFFPDKLKQRTVLFADIAKEYLAGMRQGRNRDKQHAEQRVPVLLQALKDAALKELTPGRLDSVLTGLADQRDWTPATQNRYRSLLSGIFRLAVRNGRTASNPVRETTHLHENNKRCRYLSDDEEAKLMTVIRAGPPEREAEIVVALHSGMRRSEQYQTCQVPDGGLKWEHLNLRVGVIRLPRSKSGKARDIPMNSVLRETLGSLPQRIDSPYVFDGTDPNKWFGKAIKRAGIRDFHWHDLRHTFASRLAMAGVPLRHIAELLGHSEIQTTMRYAHLQPGHLADAVEKLAAESRDRSAIRTATDAFSISAKVG
jgi:integrase